MFHPITSVRNYDTLAILSVLYQTHSGASLNNNLSKMVRHISHREEIIIRIL